MVGGRAGGETSARRNNDSAEEKVIKIKKGTLHSLKEGAGIRGGRKKREIVRFRKESTVSGKGGIRETGGRII